MKKFFLERKNSFFKVLVSLQSSTIGLVTLNEMKAKQEDIVQQREKKMALKQLEKEREKQKELEAKQAEKNRQKRQIQALSFSIQDDEEDEDNEDDDEKKDVSFEKKHKPKKIKKNPDVDTSFLPDRYFIYSEIGYIKINKKKFLVQILQI